MKKKIISLFSLLCLLFFVAIGTADAAIKTKADITVVVKKLNSLSKTDMTSFVNKSELIGVRKERFSLYSTQYQRKIVSTVENLQNISNSIDVINKSLEISNTEKKMQLQKLYQEADAALGDVDNITLDFLVGSEMLPSITQQRFIKKFLAYYNSLNITDQNITFEK